MILLLCFNGVMRIGEMNTMLARNEETSSWIGLRVVAQAKYQRQASFRIMVRYEAKWKLLSFSHNMTRSLSIPLPLLRWIRHRVQLEAACT